MVHRRQAVDKAIVEWVEPCFIASEAPQPHRRRERSVAVVRSMTRVGKQLGLHKPTRSVFGNSAPSCIQYR